MNARNFEWSTLFNINYKAASIGTTDTDDVLFDPHTLCLSNYSIVTRVIEDVRLHLLRHSSSSTIESCFGKSRARTARQMRTIYGC